MDELVANAEINQKNRYECHFSQTKTRGYPVMIR